MMLIIGEKINSSIGSVASAIRQQDKGFIQKLALDQVQAGAGIIDVNAGAFLEKEVELLPWLVEVVQEVVDSPLCIDSPNPAALEKALAITRKKAIINSISLEGNRYESIMPLIKEHQSAVIGLCMDDRGIPATTSRRFAIAQRLADQLLSDGMNADDIYIDVMAQPIGTDSISGQVTLDTVRAITETIPGVHITCGLSNVSYGLPKRKLLNQTFAVALAAYGMDTFFIDPLDERMMALLYGINALVGADQYCAGYLGAFRAGKLTPAGEGQASGK